MKLSELLKKMKGLNSSYNLLVAGIDDGGFKPDFKYIKEKPSVPLIVVYYRNHRIIDLKFSAIKIDGLDATEKLIEILKLKKPSVIFSAGITVAGFNIIDFIKIYDTLKIPTIVVLDHKPNLKRIKDAIAKHLDNAEKRISIIMKYPKFKKFKNLYYESIGIDEKLALELINSFRIFSKYPEPLRLAHMIAKSLYKYSLEKESHN
jgi:endonuclease V-like protein UPF0215 family